MRLSLTVTMERVVVQRIIMKRDYSQEMITSIKSNCKKLDSEGSGDGNAKKYSNKGGRDDNKYNRHPYITHTCTLASQNTVLSILWSYCE